MTAYLLDTNVWLRGVQPAAAQHVLAVNTLATLLARGDDIVITAQNLIEFWSVATRPVEANGLGWPVATAQLEIERVQALFPHKVRTSPICSYDCRCGWLSSLSPFAAIRHSLPFVAAPLFKSGAGGRIG